MDGPSSPTFLTYDDTTAGAVSVQVRTTGYTRITGAVIYTGAHGAGTPRIEQFGKATAAVTTYLTESPAGSGIYPVDVEIVAPYMTIVLATGAGTVVEMTAQLVTNFGSNSVSPSPGEDALHYVASATNQYDTAVTIGNSDVESLTIDASSVLVKRVMLVTTQNLSWFVGFYSSTDAAPATVNANDFLGGVSFDASEAVVLQDVPSGTTMYLYDKEVSIPYFDEANAAQLHTRLSPQDGSKTTAVASVRVFYEV